MASSGNVDPQHSTKYCGGLSGAISAFLGITASLLDQTTLSTPAYLPRKSHKPIQGLFSAAL